MSLSSAVAGLDDLVADYRALAQAFRLEDYFTPVDRARVVVTLRHDLDAGREHSPILEHEPIPPQSHEPFERLRTRVDPHGSPWHQDLFDDLTATLGLIDAGRHRSAAAIGAASEELWSAPNSAVVAHARRLLEALPPPEPSDPDLSATEAADLLRLQLERSGLTTWTVTVEERMAARMSVRGEQRRVRVRAGSRFSKADLRRLAVHELGTHVVRSENGSRQPLHVLGIGLADYLLTEEGLATFHEVRYDLSSPALMRMYAGRVVAVDEATREGFAGVLRVLLDWFEPDAAIELTLRVKRGMSDTSEPGAYTKDHVYLTGHRAVRDHLASHPSDHELLLLGKTTLGQLPALRELLAEGALAPVAFRPDQFVWED